MSGSSKPAAEESPRRQKGPLERGRRDPTRARLFADSISASDKSALLCGLCGGGARALSSECGSVLVIGVGLCETLGRSKISVVVSGGAGDAFGLLLGQDAAEEQGLGGRGDTVSGRDRHQPAQR